MRLLIFIRLQTGPALFPAHFPFTPSLRRHTSFALGQASAISPYIPVWDYLSSGQYPLFASIKSSRIFFATPALGTVFDSVNACHSF